MMILDDIEINHVMYGKASNRDGGGVEGQERATLVPHSAAAVDDIRVSGG
jgi:hypothetical protein